MFSHVRRTILGVVVGLTIPVAATGQQPSAAVSVVGGLTQYDLSGTGTVAFGALRYFQPLDRIFSVEPGLTVMADSTQSDTRNLRMMPEVQIQAQFPGGVFRPYVGLGAGVSVAMRDEPLEDQLDATLSAAGGVRLRVGAGWLLTGELRIRAIDPWTGTTADWGIGIGREL